MSTAADSVLEKLSAQELDLTSLMTAINRSQAMVEFSLDGIILNANVNFLSCVGYRLDEVQGRHHRMFCTPQYAASEEYEIFWRRLGEGEFHEGEFKRLAKNGQPIWLQATYNPVLDNQGNPVKSSSLLLTLLSSVSSMLTMQERLQLLTAPRPLLSLISMAEC
ncbi:PAS domain-containing protein [Pseudomonas asuensis]